MSSKELKTLSSVVPSYVDALRILNELRLDDYHASDRMAAIVGATLIEDALKFAIVEKFARKPDKDEEPRLFGYEGNGPLSSLGSRISFAFYLGVFGPATREDLKLVSLIRNVFAHSAIAVSFQEPKIVAACGRLKLIDLLQTPPRSHLLSAKEAYIEVCAQITGRLSLRMKGAPHSGLQFTVNPLP